MSKTKEMLEEKQLQDMQDLDWKYQEIDFAKKETKNNECTCTPEQQECCKECRLTS